MEKPAGNGNLEDIRDYMIAIFNDKYNEHMVSMLAMLSQTNLKIDRYSLDKESDIKKQYDTLRKRILAYLQERKKYLKLIMMKILLTYKLL